ncbi:MAG: hypothetical protein LBH35_05650 [Treponema sp.]|jgi:hypothetical protein|nr:hypothetical protein [Treponema sp.]
MIKKSFFMACLFVLVAAASAFAANFEISLGGGPFLGANFTSSETEPANLGIGTSKLAYDTKTFDAGVSLFADLTYVELSAAYLAEIGQVSGKSFWQTVGSLADQIETYDEDYVSHTFVVDLLGKYPFAITQSVTIFPVLGIGLKFPFAGNSNSDKEHDIAWGVAVKGGAGFDFSFTRRLFLRCEALFGYQFLSDKNAKVEQNGQTVDFKFKSAGYNLGPQVKVALGYKFLSAGK